MEPVTVFNFTRVYETETFYRDIPHEWIECTDLKGVSGFCDDEALLLIGRRLRGAKGRIHYIDGGNYHYISYAAVMEIRKPFTLVVFDHHTDMKPPVFEGLLSCGCWIKRALDDNANLKRVILLGVADELVDTIEPEYSGRVTVVPESEAARTDAWIREICGSVSGPVYVSVDKDAFSREETVTDWDQGAMTLGQLEAVLQNLKSNCEFLGADICGEADLNGVGDMTCGEAVRINDEANLKILKIITEVL